MRIVDIRETAIPLKSQLKNSIFDFSEMTTSVVAVITDVVRDGKPVAGFAFNSTGRYACGAQMRDRFIPRILRADPKSLLDQSGDNLDPAKILAVMRQREKIGGDTERSVGIGTIEVAVWDAVAKIAGQAALSRAGRALQRRQGAGQGVLLCRRRLVFPGPDHQGPAGRDAPPSRCRLHAGQDEGRRPAARRRLPADRGVLKVLGSEHRLAVDANGKFEREEGLAYAKALAPFRLPGSRSRAIRSTSRSMPRSPTPTAQPIGAGENLYSIQDVVNLARFGGLKAGRDFLQIDPPQSYGFTEYVRMLDTMKTLGWARTSFFPHGGNQMSLAVAAGLGLAGTESYPGVFGVFAGFADDAKVEGGMMTLSDRPGIGFEGQAALYAVMKDLVRVDLAPEFNRLAATQRRSASPPKKILRIAPISPKCEKIYRALPSAPPRGHRREGARL